MSIADFVRPICLPTSDVSLDPAFLTMKGYAAGWGQVNRNIPRSRIKQHVQLPLVDTQVCAKVKVKNILFSLGMITYSYEVR
jgi:hypothetical protein